MGIEEIHPGEGASEHMYHRRESETMPGASEGGGAFALHMDWSQIDRDGFLEKCRDAGYGNNPHRYVDAIAQQYGVGEDDEMIETLREFARN